MAVACGDAIPEVTPRMQKASTLFGDLLFLAILHIGPL